MSKSTPQQRLEQFLNTYSGRELVKKYDMSQTGVWKVLGEDPNCDFGGHHYQPELGMFAGTLEDVMAYAVTLSNFWAWGAGGDIQLMSAPVKIDKHSTARRVAAEQKVKELEAALEKARKELGELQ
jgi:hypothetical protein